MTNDEIEKAFGVADLPKPWSVAPNQPFTGRFYYTWGALPLLLLLIVGCFNDPAYRGDQNRIFTADRAAAGERRKRAADRFQPAFRDQGQPKCEIDGRRAECQQQLGKPRRRSGQRPEQRGRIDTDRHRVLQRSATATAHGARAGKNRTPRFHRCPAGKYTMRVEGTWGAWQQPLPVELKVEQGVTRGVNFICAFIILLMMPLIGLIRKMSFEGRRWRDSMFSSTAGQTPAVRQRRRRIASCGISIEVFEIPQRFTRRAQAEDAKRAKKNTGS